MRLLLEQSLEARKASESCQTTRCVYSRSLEKNGRAADASPEMRTRPLRAVSKIATRVLSMLRNVCMIEA